METARNVYRLTLERTVNKQNLDFAQQFPLMELHVIRNLYQLIPSNQRKGCLSFLKPTAIYVKLEELHSV